ncbi:ERF family protein [Streptomyces sp. NPDC056401]|uniref:ERF family protein n=1 Tax=Streptomyces sp. NPDC056401 TaxID=3345809 RepID=UPI0035E17F87
MDSSVVAEPSKKNGRVLGDMLVPPVIAMALLEVQKELKPMVKSATNDDFNSGYVPLDDVLTYAIELLNKHHIAVMQPALTDENDHVALKTMLIHRSGVGYEATSRLALSKADSQGHGSAITYMRRYALMSMIGLTAKGDDDDGNKAAGVSAPATKDQRDRLGSLMALMSFPAEEIARVQRNIRTRDHAAEQIVKYEKLISTKRREREAEQAALDTENGATHIDVEDAPKAHPISERIAKLGLLENKIVFAATNKPFLKNCDADDLDTLVKTLDAIEQARVKPPASWFRDGKRPAHLDVEDKNKPPKEGEHE